MSFKFNTKNVNNILYKDSTKKRFGFKNIKFLQYKENINADPIIVWAKAGKLIYSYDNYFLKSVVVTRIFSNNQQATLGRIYSQADIYYGDILIVNVELLDKYIGQYEIDAYDSQIVVTDEIINNNYRCYYSAHKIN